MATSYYSLIQSMGICPRCRKEKLKEGEKRCPKCRAKANAATKKYMENRIKNRLCTYCGQPLEKSEKFQRCKKCREFVAQRHRDNWKKYKRQSAHPRTDYEI